MTKKNFLLLSIIILITSIYSCNEPVPSSEFQKNLKNLNDIDSKNRVQAVFNLGEMGDYLLIPELLPALLKTLNDPDKEVRRTVIQALYKVRGISSIPKLMILANDKNETAIIRCEALRVSIYLWLRNKTNYDLLTEITKLYKDPNKQLRLTIIESLGESREKRSIELIHSAVKDKSPEIRIVALNIILSMEDVTTLPLIINALGDADPKVRKAAVRALAIGGKTSIPQLLKMLSDDDYFVVINAAVLLNKLGNSAGIPSLKKMLKNENPKICIAAAMVLYEEMEDNSGIPVLINLLNHEDDQVKITAIKLLKIGDKKAVNALIPVLSDINPKIRTQAAVSLGEIGNVSCVPKLVTALNNDTVSAFRVAIVQALGNLPCEASVEVLKKTLFDKDLSVRLFSVNSLSLIGNSDLIPLLNSVLLKQNENIEIKKAVITLYRTNGFRQTSDILSKGLTNTDPEFCAMTISVLGEWGEKEYFNDIKELKSKDPKIRANAILSLSRMGNPAASQSIARHLKDKLEEEQIRTLSAITIGSIGNKEILPILINVVKDKNEIKTVRGSAITGLAYLKDKKAVPVLIDILKNENDPGLLTSATQALGFIKDKTATAFIVPLLKSDITALCITSLGALIELKDSTAVPALLNLLIKKITINKEIDYEAGLICELLGNIKDKRAIPLLKEIWKHKSNKLMPTVAKALYQLGETYTIQYIKECATQNENIGLQVQAICTLGELGDKSALEVVTKGLNSSEYAVRKESVIALGKLGDKSSISRLKKMLTTEDISMDVNIAEAIVSLGDNSGFEKLISILKNKTDIQIKTEIMDAFGRLKNKSALPLLNQIKENDISWELRNKAHETIKQINAVES